MYTFNVERNGNKLSIISNTFWSCSSYGDVILNKCSGNGNGEITMSVPKEMEDAYASIYFTYGDDRCDYPAIDVYLKGCYIETEPSYVQESNRNVLRLTYENGNDGVNIKVLTNGSWRVSDSAATYINGDDLTIIPNKLPSFNSCSASTMILCDCGNIDVELYNSNGGDYTTILTALTHTETTGYYLTSSQTEFGCERNNFWTSLKENYDVYETSAFTDCCGNVYSDITIEGVARSGTKTIETKRGTFYARDCCNGSYYDSITFDFSQRGFESSITFTQICEDCSSDPGCHVYTCKICGKDVLPCGSGSTKYCISEIGICTGSDCEQEPTTLKISCYVDKGEVKNVTTASNIHFAATKGDLDIVGIGQELNKKAKSVDIDINYSGATVSSPTVVCNDGQTYNAECITCPTIVDGAAYKIKLIKECPHPGATIQMAFYMGYLGGGYEYFFMADIETLNDSQKEWIKQSGAKFYGDYRAPIFIGDYKYEGCEFKSYDTTNGKYCCLSSGSPSNKKLEPGASYYFYGYRNNSFVKKIQLQMPTGVQAQNNCIKIEGDLRYYLTTPENF